MEKNIFSIEIVDEVPKRLKNCFAVYGGISNTYEKENPVLFSINTVGYKN